MKWRWLLLVEKSLQRMNAKTQICSGLFEEYVFPIPLLSRTKLTKVQGGGGTFGVLTRITVRTVPALPLAVYDFSIQASQNSTEYWNSLSYLISQLPTISSHNISAFIYLYPSIGSFEALFVLPSPNSPTELETVISPTQTYINTTWGHQTNISGAGTTYPNLETVFQLYADASTAGVDKVVGSWLLPPSTLTNSSALLDPLKTFLDQDGGRLYMVSGQGVWDAVPRGGSNAVNPAWRKALVHAVTSSNWTPLDERERASVEWDVGFVRTEALRRLVPESGAYLNEVCLHHFL